MYPPFKIILGPPLYAEFPPHMASLSLVEANRSVMMSHRNDLIDMMLQKFKMWTILKVKSYLREREREFMVRGTKEYLIAREFSALEMKTPVVISQQKGKGYKPNHTATGIYSPTLKGTYWTL